MVSRRSPVPLYQQIEEDLRRRIAEGDLPPLTQLPSEVELADEFGVSRMTARRAVEELANSGLVFRRLGKGTFVASPKITHKLSTSASFTAVMDSHGIPHQTRVLGTAIVAAPPHVALALELPPETAVIYIRRVRDVAGAPAAHHEAYVPGRYASIREEDLEGSLTDLMRKAGAAVASATDWVEATAADLEMAEILSVEEGSPLLRVEGTGFSTDGRPVRYSRALYRGDRFRFRLEASADPATPWLRLVPVGTTDVDGA